MKNLFCLFILITLIIPTATALNLQFDKETDSAILVYGLSRPAVFNLTITNLGETDSIEFYNEVGFKMSPLGKTKILSQETKTFEIGVTPPESFSQKGKFNFDYTITSQDGSQLTRKLFLKFVDLEDVFEIGAESFDPESSSVNIYIQNKEGINLGELNAKFLSAFFEVEEKFELGPFEKKEFTIVLNKEDYNKLKAGFYTLNADITIKDQTVSIEGKLEFKEKNIVTDKSNEYGLFIYTKTISKSNDGNVVADVETQITKNIISRLFTTFSPEPDMVERNFFTVTYTWSQTINPGEALDVKVKTNWFFPFLIIIFIVIIIVFAKKYTETDLIMRKKVSFVRAKGGEFALKVSVNCQARKYLERVNIIDRLPPLVKIYERFGAEKPDKIDEKNRRLEWNFEKLEPGEARILSYIIYSKIGVLGKFALPSAIAIYQKQGNIKESESNRAFFVAEQRTKDIEEG